MPESLLIKENKDLKNHTSWLVGGLAQFYCAPTSLFQLKEALIFADKNSLNITVLGGGTNVLISDEGVKGLVIHTINLSEIKILQESPDLKIQCLSGVAKSEALKIFMKYRLEPAVFLAGLPGDVAGGVVMNAGVGHNTHPKEFFEIIESVNVFNKNENGEWFEKTYRKDEIDWSYRKSKNWQPGIISKVTLIWPNQPNENVLKAVREGNKRRKDTQPLHEPSCGSVFKNPPHDHAGRLIEASGLKGFTIGGAQVSTKHANFIVNTGNSTALDIHQVIHHVQKTVKDKMNVQLTNEVVYLGEWNH